MKRKIKSITLCFLLIAATTFALNEIKSAKIGYCLTKYNSTGAQAAATATFGAMGTYAGATYGAKIGAKIGCISGPGGAILGGVIGCGVGAL